MWVLCINFAVSVVVCCLRSCCTSCMFEFFWGGWGGGVGGRLTLCPYPAIVFPPSVEDPLNCAAVPLQALVCQAHHTNVITYNSLHDGCFLSLIVPLNRTHTRQRKRLHIRWRGESHLQSHWGRRLLTCLTLLLSWRFIASTMASSVLSP